MAEIRNYRFTYREKFGKFDPDLKVVVEHESDDIQVPITAYDLNEAMIQFQIKYGTSVSVTEVTPFKYIEEQKPVVEQKKEVHVKPLPKRD